MIISEKEYSGYIKPLIDNTITVSKQLTEQEFAIVGDKLIKIIESEFNYDDLLNNLNSISPLGIEICKKYEMYHLIENAINFLSNKKSS